MVTITFLSNMLRISISRQRDEYMEESWNVIN